MRAERPLVAILLLCLAQGASAVSRLAVVGGTEEFRAHFTTALSAQLVAGGLPTPTIAAPHRSDLVLALGDEAFQEALHLNRPVLGLFISRNIALEAFTAGCACSAFFSEADPVRQLRLAQALFPAARRIGLITSPETSWVAGLLAPYAERESLLLVHTALADSNALARELPRLLPQVDLLLAVGDERLYSEATARLILLTSYRQNKPVIGPDELFVYAGSVATSYSSGADMVKQAARAVLDFAERGRLPPPDFASVFSLRLNSHVVRAYDVPMVDPDALQRQLEAGQ